MPRDYDDDDRGPRRRDRDYDRRDDYDDDELEERYEGRRRGRGNSMSGATVTAGVLNFIMGGLHVLCGGLMLLFGAAFTARFGGADVGGIIGFILGIIFIIGSVMLIAAILAIIAGVGVVKCENWGRILTLVVSALFGLLGILYLIGAFGGPRLNFVAILLGFFYIAYPVLCFILLLGPGSRDFR